MLHCNISVICQQSLVKFVSKLLYFLREMLKYALILLILLLFCEIL